MSQPGLELSRQTLNRQPIRFVTNYRKVFEKSRKQGQKARSLTNSIASIAASQPAGRPYPKVDERALIVVNDNYSVYCGIHEQPQINR